MSSKFGVLDIPTLAKETWELYNLCHPLAEEAPDSFRKLVHELESLQTSLRALGDDIGSNAAFFDSMGEDRKLTLERCVSACFQTLQRLRDLVNRYRELGVGDGRQFWRKIKWITQRQQIENIRSKIMVHTCNLTLCVSPIGNASLVRIERTVNKAMEEDEQAILALRSAPERDSDSIVSPLSARGLFSVELEDTSETIRARMASQRALSPSSLAPRHMSTSSGSMISGSDGSFYGLTTPISPLSTNTARSISQSLRGKTGHARTRSDQILPEVINGGKLDRTFWEETSDIQEKEITEKASESSQTDFGHDHVTEAIASAMQQLRQVRIKEQLARPIRYEAQNGLHKPDAELTKAFEASVNEESRFTRTITRDWLRIATWWLLKARATLANCNRHSLVSARGSVSPSTDSRTISNQAYVDLLKASYVLYDVVLKDESSQALLSDENRKSIADLSEVVPLLTAIIRENIDRWQGINEELSQYTTIDIPEPSTLHLQNLAIWESLQPEEASDHLSEYSFGLENARWIAVDQDDAGSEEERVHYRTFVNAGIGGKKLRMRTKGAPYMLLLATREGESEPQLILCNQSGSLCLQRDFAQDDLPPLTEISNATLTGFPGTRISEPVPFKFGNTSVSISFQFEAELANFINIPKAYFDAVYQREPVDSKEFTESVIFKNSVEMVEQLKPPNMKPMNPPVITKSCEVRILERSYGQAWRSTRRMVISPSAAEKEPHCTEFFMPLSRVQIGREDVSRQVLLKWSDTCQERSDKTDGSYNTLHSHVYDDSAPNIGVAIHFRSQQAAEEFEKAILELNFRPDFAWSQPSSSGRIYDVVDTETDQKQYKAVALFQNRSSWRYSDVYYLYRDTDFAYEHSSLSVRFPRAYYTGYISNHVDQLYHADGPVTFSHCEKKTGQAIIEFNNETVSRSFLSALSPLYELQYSRRVHSLSTKSKSLFGSKKSSKGGAEIQLWRRGNGFQLAARWDDHIPEKWLTMTLSSDCSHVAKEGFKVNFPKMAYTRGATLDMMNILARSLKSHHVGNREGPLSIVFQNAKDREQFLAVL